MQLTAVVILDLKLTDHDVRTKSDCPTYWHRLNTLLLSLKYNIINNETVQSEVVSEISWML